MMTFNYCTQFPQNSQPVSRDVINRHLAGPLQDSDAAAADADADEHWHSLTYARRAAGDVIVI